MLEARKTIRRDHRCAVYQRAARAVPRKAHEALGIEAGKYSSTHGLDSETRRGAHVELVNNRACGDLVDDETVCAG